MYFLLCEQNVLHLINQHVKEENFDLVYFPDKLVLNAHAACLLFSF